MRCKTTRCNTTPSNGRNATPAIGIRDGLGGWVRKRSRFSRIGTGVESGKRSRVSGKLLLYQKVESGFQIGLRVESENRVGFLSKLLGGHEEYPMYMKRACYFFRLLPFQSIGSNKNNNLI